jgi:hypothetical protein
MVRSPRESLIELDGSAAVERRSEHMGAPLLAGSRVAAAALIAAVLVAALLVADAHAASPKPWQWTTGHASRAVVSAHLAVFPSSTGDNGEITSATCVGQGPATSSRFAAFRCSISVFFNGKPVREAIVWVKVRKVGKGQVCANLKSFAAIPASCLSRRGAPRTEGSTLHAWYALREAMTVRMGTSTRWVAAIGCLSFGAGFYTCAFENATESGSASVTLTTDGPVVHVTAIECVRDTERPGCSPT